jgi:signal peptidase II
MSEVLPSETEPKTSEGASSDALGAAEQPAGAAASALAPKTGLLLESDSLAPEAERMGPPTFAAKTIADPVVAGPSGLFLALVATTSFVADIGSKLWAEKRLEAYPGYLDVMEGHLAFTLAKNKGGAWGLLQGTSEGLRRPFFLLVSIAAISFIVTLYRRLSPKQHALRWGLPLVLGGALGNVFDRLRYGHVIDFIDYRAEWVRRLNEWVAKRATSHIVTDHWPTFNVADVAICVGVGLMAVDMFTSKRGVSVQPSPNTPNTPNTLAQPESVEPAEAQTTQAGEAEIPNNSSPPTT